MKIKRTRKGVRVQYPAAKEVFLIIRPIHFSESLDLLSQAKEKVMVDNYPIDPKDPSKKGPMAVDNYREGAFLWKTFDQALESWEGITVELEEGEIPLGPVEIKKVLFDDEGIREFVMKTSRELAEGELRQQEEERKNS